MSSTEKNKAKNKALQLSKEILSGEVGLLLGIRKLLPNLFVLGLDNHPDFIIFKGIDSQEDHLPVGPERVYWNKEALAKKDLEVAEAEKFHRDLTFKACESLSQYLQQLDV